jgi:hypothetical protein
LICAAKYLNDASPKNKHWQRYAVHFSLPEVNLMEKQLLYLMDYNLRIEEEDILLHLEPFLRLAPAEVRVSKIRTTMKRESNVVMEDVREMVAMAPPIQTLPSPPITPLVHPTPSPYRPHDVAATAQRHHRASLQVESTASSTEHTRRPFPASRSASMSGASLQQPQTTTSSASSSTSSMASLYRAYASMAPALTHQLSSQSTQVATPPQSTHAAEPPSPRRDGKRRLSHMQMSPPPTLVRHYSDDTATSDSDDSSAEFDESDVEYAASHVHLAVPRHSATVYDVRMPPPARSSHRRHGDVEVQRAPYHHPTMTSSRSDKPKRDSYGPRSPIHAADVRSRQSMVVPAPPPTIVTLTGRRTTATAAAAGFGTVNDVHCSIPVKHSRNPAMSLKSSMSLHGLRNLLTGRGSAVDDEFTSLAARRISGDQLIIVQ